MIPSDYGDITFFLVTCALSLALATVIFEAISAFARWVVNKAETNKREQ